jgi:Ca2+-binding RTX toxin-like protein
METLESRRMLSATLTNGLLSVVTGDGDDDVTVGFGLGRSVVVTENGATTSFAMGDVTKIEVSTGGGNDKFATTVDTLVVRDNGVTTVYTLPDVSVSGGDGNDTLRTGRGNDTLVGGAGNDSLQGQDGQDAIGGNEGDDYIDGGAGNDSMHGGVGGDTIFGGAAADGNDVMDSGGGGIATLDVLDFSSRPIGIRIYVGQPVASGQFGVEADTINAGFTIIYGTNGDDHFIGTNGTDFYNSMYGNDRTEGRGGDDFLSNFSGKDTMLGGDGDDVLDSAEGDSSLDGGAGDDTFETFTGNDTVIGGPGIDTVTYANRNVPLTLFIEPTARSGQNGEKDFLNVDLENVIGGRSDDFIVGTEAENRLEGGDGNDSIDGVGGRDEIIGGRGDDTLEGNRGNDQLDGGEGNDTLRGFEGNDNLQGNDGNDELFGGADNDALDGGAGSDRMFGEDGIDTADYHLREDNLRLCANGRAESGASGENDTIAEDIEAITAGSGNDTLLGSDRADSMFGELGSDVIRGFGGDDLLVGGFNGSDTIDGGTGRDRMFAQPYGADEGDRDMIDYSSRGENFVIRIDGKPTSGAAGEGDTIYAGFEIIAGGLGNDKIFGTDRAETILGNAGNDELRGFGGNDRLDGGAGNDRLIGGDGDDVLIGRAGRDTLYGQNGADNIYADDRAFDYVFGGAGRDKFRADKGDRLVEVELRK